jgi:hypothetical protein
MQFNLSAMPGFGKTSRREAQLPSTPELAELIGVVITFDDTENKAWITVSEMDLDRFIGHDAAFQFSKTKDFKGKVIGVETDFLVVKFEEQPLGLGQGSQVSIAD